MDWKSVTDITTLRECVAIRGGQSIENMIEDKFVNGEFRSVSIPLPLNVSSTISISVSHDGNYFATTHGDHTVKVFMYHTFKLVREFRGHPRTPWTVKFHPKDSDKVASGCLGCQVLVWSIAQNQCINKIRLEFSIISICFHPDGDHIAIASGTKLELWNWSITQKSSHGGYNLAPSTAAPPISHVRNVRAVTFHPSGDYLFAAAPDAPRQANETVTYCSLFGIKFSEWLQLNDSTLSPTMMQEDQNSLLHLTNHSLILPQIHLYSDGGIDITKDGEHLISCSRLFYPPPPPIVVNNNGTDTKIGLSPLSTTERMEEDEQLRHSDMPTTWIDNNNLPISPTPNPTIAVPIPFLSPSIANTTGAATDSNSALTLQNQLFEGPSGNLGRALALRNQLLVSSNSINSQGLFSNQYHRDGTHAFSAPSVLTVLGNTTRGDSNTILGQRPQTLPFPSSSSFAGRNIVNPPRINQPGSFETLYSSKRMISSTNYRNRQPTLRVMNASLFIFDSQNRRLDHNVTPLPPGWRVDDHLCIFKLQFRKKYLPDGTEDIPEIMYPQIVNAKPLTGGLMRAITSVKWSPTNRYVLMGFGVRSNNHVQDHAFPLAACEILSTQSTNLQTVKVVEDLEDEVNIAQFHPMPGYGVVYGTKRGKTRVFVLPKK